MNVSKLVVHNGFENDTNSQFFKKYQNNLVVQTQLLEKFKMLVVDDNPEVLPDIKDLDIVLEYCKEDNKSILFFVVKNDTELRTRQIMLMVDRQNILRYGGSVNGNFIKIYKG